jgi:hypothetical protein
VALVFVYRSFYGMRIPEEKGPATAKTPTPQMRETVGAGK